MIAYQQGEIRILCVAGRVFIAVSVHRYNSIGIFTDDNTAGIHAEGTDLVLELRRTVYDFAFIQFIRQIGENAVGQFYTHTDVHTVALRGNSQAFTDASHPFASTAACGYNAFAAGKAFIPAHQTIAVLQLFHCIYMRLEVDFNFILQLIVQVFQNNIIHIRTKMAYACLQQM